MFAFSLHLWDRRSPNGLLFWHARCLTHACKEWFSCSYKLHTRIDSMSTVNWSTNVILQSTSITRTIMDSYRFRSPSRSNPHSNASTTGSHISSFRSLRWSAWQRLMEEKFPYVSFFPQRKTQPLGCFQRDPSDSACVPGFRVQGERDKLLFLKSLTLLTSSVHRRTWFRRACKNHQKWKMEKQNSQRV